MATEFDEHLQERLRAFQLDHGMSGDGGRRRADLQRLMSAPATHTPAESDGGANEPVQIPLSDYPSVVANLPVAITCL